MTTETGKLCKYQGHLVEITAESGVHTRRIKFVGKGAMHGESCLVGADTLSECSTPEFREYIRAARNKLDNQVIKHLTIQG